MAHNSKGSAEVFVEVEQVQTKCTCCKLPMVKHTEGDLQNIEFCPSALLGIPGVRVKVAIHKRKVEDGLEFLDWFCTVKNYN
jgi:hypothetical protein